MEEPQGQRADLAPQACRGATGRMLAQEGSDGAERFGRMPELARN
jgi:hypothetical protein